MQSPFTLFLPLPEGCIPESLPGLLALLDHAASKGHPMRVVEVKTFAGTGGITMVRLTLVKGKPSTVSP